LNGTAARALRSADLSRLVRSIWEDQRRFPLQIATVLSQQFAGHGLQFFKVNKTITHVSVARPHYLDLALTPVSEGVQRIVEFINTHLKCNRRLLVETLAPSPAPAPVPVPDPAAGEAPPASPPASREPTPEQNAVIGDLHWLIHQGHVIEFANGVLETAKKPIPRPPKPQAKPAESPVEGALPTPVASVEETGTDEPAPAVPTFAPESTADNAPVANPSAPEPETTPGGLPTEAASLEAAVPTSELPASVPETAGGSPAAEPASQTQPAPAAPPS
jgi:hypothetical protein